VGLLRSGGCRWLLVEELVVPRPTYAHVAVTVKRQGPLPSGLSFVPTAGRTGLEMIHQRVVPGLGTARARYAAKGHQNHNNTRYRSFLMAALALSADIACTDSKRLSARHRINFRFHARKRGRVRKTGSYPTRTENVRDQ
jgi:hypothetical protein